MGFDVSVPDYCLPINFSFVNIIDVYGKEKEVNEGEVGRQYLGENGDGLYHFN